MTELKTLKDWEIEQDEENGVVDIEWLKTEAVKWVKELERFEEYAQDGLLSTTIGGLKVSWEPEECYEPLEMAKWIKHFFNLTEEDLTSADPQTKSSSEGCGKLLGEDDGHITKCGMPNAQLCDECKQKQEKKEDEK